MRAVVSLGSKERGFLPSITGDARSVSWWLEGANSGIGPLTPLPELIRADEDDGCPDHDGCPCSLVGLVLGTVRVNPLGLVACGLEVPGLPDWFLARGVGLSRDSWYSRHG